MTILVDMDEVLERMIDTWVSWLNAKFGTTVKYDDITKWDIEQFFPGVPETEVYAPLRCDEFWDDIKPRDGAVNAIRRLIDRGHEVYVLTNSHYKSLASKMENVLFKYFPFLTWDNVIIAANKQMVWGDILVDDALHNLIGGHYFKILMDAPYNRSVNDREYDLHRAYNWDDVMDYINIFECRRDTAMRLQKEYE